MWAIGIQIDACNIAVDLSGSDSQFVALEQEVLSIVVQRICAFLIFQDQIRVLSGSVLVASTRLPVKPLADIRGVSFDELARQTTDNFFRLFSKVPRTEFLAAADALRRSVPVKSA